MKMITVKQFMSEHKGGFYLYAAEDVPGFYKKGNSIYGNADNMEVVSWLYQPLNGIYSLRVK